MKNRLDWRVSPSSSRFYRSRSLWGLIRSSIIFNDKTKLDNKKARTQQKKSKKVWRMFTIMRCSKLSTRLLIKGVHTKTRASQCLGPKTRESLSKRPPLKKPKQLCSKHRIVSLSGHRLVLDLNTHPYRCRQHKLKMNLETKSFRHHYKMAKRTERISVDRRNWVTWWLKISRRPTICGQTTKWRTPRWGSTWLIWFLLILLAKSRFCSSEIYWNELY